MIGVWLLYLIPAMNRFGMELLKTTITLFLSTTKLIIRIYSPEKLWKWVLLKHLKKLISEDIVRGTERIAYTTAVLASENPWVWAVDAGIWLGDAVWNTSSVDKQALSTIALGDTSACFSKYIYTKLYNDSGNYYHIYNDNFYLLSVFCQLRIVAENEFKATTDSYSWLYDLLTDIKDSSDDACRGTINIVKGIANRYGKILICEPNYDGAKVNV